MRRETMWIWGRVVLVPENDVGLVAVSQLLHVFPPDGLQLSVGESVIGMGVEREVDHRLFRPEVGGKVGLEAAHAFRNAGRAVGTLHDTVPCQGPGLALVHFLLVVIKRPVDGHPGRYLCNHRSNSLVRRMISLFSEMYSTVSCSSL